MYKPSKYGNHNDSMDNFIKIFNGCEKYKNIVIIPNPQETFTNDGYIIDEETNQKIGYDWEYRVKYFENGKFAFDSLGQYERKIYKPCIDISLQCDSTETAVMVAWHEDWKNEIKTQLNLETDYAKKQFGTVRYTKKFKIYKYSEIEKLKAMIDKAFKTGNFNSESFDN